MWLFIVSSENRLCDLLVCRYDSGYAFHVDLGFFRLFYGPQNGVPALRIKKKNCLMSKHFAPRNGYI